MEDLTPPAPGSKWDETRELNHAIYVKRRGHALSRVMRDAEAGHAASMKESDLLGVGRFAWCGKAWSAAKRMVAAASSTGRGVIILDIASGNRLLTLPDEPGAVWWLAWSPDSSRLAVSRSEGDISIWHVPKSLAIFEDAKLGVLMHPETAGTKAAPTATP